MLKIGIITHYHNSTNYGGSLQAYALCKALEELGHTAYQLRIDHSACCTNLLNASSVSSLKKLIGKPLRRAVKTALSLANPRQRKVRKEKQLRHQALLAAFSPFNLERTPHSDCVYTEKTIRKAPQIYDAFITGSDQVWNPSWYFPPFFLTFAPAGVPKISYAASLACKQLPAHVKAVYRKNLQDYIGVSVREADAVALLEGVAPGPVSCVLDPTLLLSRQDWSAIAQAPQLSDAYVFCYFLGDDPAVRNTAAQFAGQNHLTLVNIPNAAGLVHENDKNFGDVQMENPSPEAFLGLIQNAQYVFTDSFHASVFSLIFQRQFFVFPRSGHTAMGSRLYSLTELFDVPDRFCDTLQKADISHITSLQEIDYSLRRPKFEAAREASVSFLQTNLKKAEEIVKK